MKVAGLFAGVGGMELGFREAGFKTELLCEIDVACRRVLKRRFLNVPIEEDILSIRQLPDVDVVTAGFPCQAFSQAGRTEGLVSSRPLLSSLLSLIRRAPARPRYVVLENVPNIVHLAGGEALRYITRVLEPLGYSWAYRIVDTSSFGLPQRRARWIFIASLSGDAASILLEQNLPSPKRMNPRAYGFYWTEGNRGLGWADDAVPPLKSGSTLGIPSPPAIWDVLDNSIVKPTIGDAERLQGFDMGWTEGDPEDNAGPMRRRRWKMVGNAVSVPTARWVAERTAAGLPVAEPFGKSFNKNDTWPKAAWGRLGRRFAVESTRFPLDTPHLPILDFLVERPEPLSARATRGFRTRLESSNLRYPDAFLDALKNHERKVRSLTA